MPKRGLRVGRGRFGEGRGEDSPCRIDDPLNNRVKVRGKKGFTLTPPVKKRDYDLGEYLTKASWRVYSLFNLRFSSSLERRLSGHGW
jgi:hypothetical protein